MKKLPVILTFLMLSAMVFAQTKNLKNADKGLKRGKLDAAVTAINLAMEEPENQVNANAWFSQAKIFTAVAASKAPEYKDLVPNAAELALKAFQKAFQLDQKGIISGLGGIEIPKLISAAYDLGATYYGEQKFAEASNSFKISVDACMLMGQPNTSEIYVNSVINTALCAKLANDNETARKYYEKVLEMSPTGHPDIYISLANVYKDMNDVANAGKYADSAVAKFADNYPIVISAASIHLETENFDRASVILDKMSETFADQPVVFFAKAIALDRIKMSAEAETAYLKAIELNPDYFDAILNLAIHYVDIAGNIHNEANLLPLSESKKYDEMGAQADAIYNKAMPLLEKAMQMEPGNVGVMSTLKDIYVRLKMLDKAQELNAEIEKLENQ